MREQKPNCREARASSEQGKGPAEPDFDPVRILKDRSYKPTKEEWAKFNEWAEIETRILDQEITRGIERLRRLAGVAPSR